MSNTEFQPCRRFVRNDLVERKINVEKYQKILKIQRKVRIKCDEKDVISALQVAFEGKIILTQ